MITSEQINFNVEKYDGFAFELKEENKHSIIVLKWYWLTHKIYVHSLNDEMMKLNYPILYELIFLSLYREDYPFI